MHEEKKLFFAEASLQKVVNYFFDVLAVAIIIYCIFKFSENPIVISIVIGFLFFKLTISGHNQIIVYRDRIDFIVKHPLNKLSSKRSLLYADIETIDAELKLTEKDFIITQVLGSLFAGISIWNTLKIKLKDGSEKVIDTKIYKPDVINALKVVKRETGNKISIKGL